jgi:hypothetical protein
MPARYRAAAGSHLFTAPWVMFLTGASAREQIFDDAAIGGFDLGADAHARPDRLARAPSTST